MLFRRFRFDFATIVPLAGIAGALWAILREHGRREDLDRITMLDWLREKHQTERAIRRFWNQVLVSAVNEDLDRMAASHGFQVFWLGFLALAAAAAVVQWAVVSLFYGMLLDVRAFLFQGVLTVATYPVVSYLLGRAQRTLLMRA